MNIGIIGYSGRVGQELLQFPNTIPLACDVRSLREVRLAVKSVRPDVIVNLASISDVDKCEVPENQKLVDATNVRGAFNVCQVASEFSCGVLILSTAHVFDGIEGNYQENSEPNPKNYYGFSKVGAESLRDIFDLVKVVRTSYLFDHERAFKHLYPLRAGEPYEYPTFIERSFMYLPHFAEALHCYLLNFDDMPSMLHISGTHTVSWYQFIRDMAGQYGLDSSLVRPRHKEIEMDVAPRPYKAGLNVDLSKKMGLPQFNYREGLQEMRRVSR